MPHPNAYLLNLRNKKKGVEARSIILSHLASSPHTAKELETLCRLKYSRLAYHLKLMEKHKVVRKRTLAKRRVVWEQTGLGQQIFTRT